VRGHAARRLAVVAILLAGFALRVYRLDARELSGDEAFGYFFALQPYAGIVQATLSLHEPHPVASYFVQKAWSDIAGDGEFALRFTSSWWGVLAVAILYRFARRLRLSPATALIGSALLAVSPYAIAHGQTARMYSMSLALTLASTCLALEALSRRRWAYWIAYVSVSWLALHTHYYAVFILAAQNIFVLAVAWRDASTRPRLLPWLAAQIALFGLYLPWLVVARTTLTGYGGAGDSPAFEPMLRRLLSAFLVGEAAYPHEQIILAALGGLLAVIGVVRLVAGDPRGRRIALLLVLCLGLPVMGIWLSAQSRPIFNERYLVAAAPAYYLLLAAGIVPAALLDESVVPVPGRRAVTRISRVVRTGLMIGGLAACLFGAGMMLSRYYEGPAQGRTAGWRELAASLAQLSAGIPAERARLVQNYPDPALWYYYRGPVPHLVLPPGPDDAQRTQAEVARMLESGVERVVLVVDERPGWDSGGLASSGLAQQYPLIAEQSIRHWPAQVYDRPGATWAPIGASFGDIGLVAASLPQTAVPPGGVLAVHLRWQGAAGRASGSEKATLQLLNSDGKLIAQVDRPIGPTELAGAPASYGIVLPQVASPGPYRLIAAVYDPSKPGAPRLLTESGADHWELATVDAAKPVPPR
jgi:4-amino-4-deoxy-L-arabinose transferase-like glycosyltransferase